MVQLIKKGGLRERANRSRRYHGSENTETTLKPNTYSDFKKQSQSSQKDQTETCSSQDTPSQQSESISHQN